MKEIKNVKRKSFAAYAISCGMATACLCSLTIVPGFAAESSSASTSTSNSVSTSTSTESKVTDALNNALNSSTVTTGQSKEETVYALAQANGTVKSITVSDWLKNYDKAATIADSSTLQGIQNTEGDETFSQSGSNVTWNAAGNDIYYSGSADKALPISLAVTYKLDGKTVSADQIAHQSGKVTIRYDYTNSSYTTETIDGEQVKIYTPFVVITGLALDNDNFSNVSVTNGKIVNDGDRTYVIGTALPGMQESLGVSDDVSIPSYVEITADASDFQIATSLTVASPGTLSDLDTSDLDTNDLSSSVDKLKDAMSQLMDGSSQLSDGLITLLQSSGDLSSGVDQLASGGTQLSDGASTLSSGADQLASGGSQLAAGTDQLSSQTATLPASTTALDNGAQSLASGLSSAVTGTDQLMAAAKSVNSGLYQLTYGTSTSTGLKDAITAIGTKTDTTPTTLYGGTNLLIAGESQMVGTPTDTSGTLYAAKNGATAVASGVSAAIVGLGQMQQATAGEGQAITAASQSAGAALGHISNAYAALGAGAQAAGGAAQALGQADYALQHTGLDTATDGLNTAASKMGDATTAVNDTATSLDGTNAAGAVTASETLGTINTSGMTSAQVDAINSAKASLADAAATSTAIETAKGNAGDATTAITNASTAVDGAKAPVSNATATVNAAETTVAGAAGTVATAAGTMSTEIGSVATVATEVGTASVALTGNESHPINALSLNNAVAGGESQLLDSTTGLPAAESGAQLIANGAQDAINGITGQIIPGLQNLQKGLTTLVSGGTVGTKTSAGLQGAVDALGSPSTQNTLIYGTTNIYGGLSQLKGNESSGLTYAANGATQLAAGTHQLAEATPTLVAGIAQLDNGAVALDNGLASLQSGAGTLSSGATTLSNGITTLQGNMPALISGVQQLSDGGVSLKNGLTQFNDEGVQKIVDAYDGDLGKIADRITPIVNAGKAYTNYSGAATGTTSSVKFVIETDSIGGDN